MATGYTIAGLLLVGGLVLCAGVATGLWLAVKAMRPELLERRRGGEPRPAGAPAGEEPRG